MAAVAEGLQSDNNVDPDAQATITDFLDYTEYLPSDLTRSLTLIKKLDESYLSVTSQIHSLLTTYGSQPAVNTGKAHNLLELRNQISLFVDRDLNIRESAFAEAARLYDEVDRHHNRLGSVKSKLQALPKPPSRDPSPVPRQLSPQLNRTRLERNGEAGGTPPPRITLRLDHARFAASQPKHHGSHHRSRPRIRRITIPGEVLPPPNSDSPPPFTDSEWESAPSSPIPMPTSRIGVPSSSRSIKPNRIKMSRPAKHPKIKGPKPPRPPRAPRPPGAMGTNVHSAVAGISTSNALSLLTPPPPDAKPGSAHAPWMRLTEWEMARLRKRMKKNAIWGPSETMIRRELSEAGRGPENYRKARQKADDTGEDFIDCDNIAASAPGKPLATGEISADSLGLELKLSNKGMKLNEAKKLKKELLAREEEAQKKLDAELAAKRLGEMGSSFKTLFNKPEEHANGAATASHEVHGPEKVKEKVTVKPPKKRKRDATPVAEETQLQAQLQSEIVPTTAKQIVKKRKIAEVANTVTTMTTTVPLAAAAPSPVKAPPATPQPPSPTGVRKPTAASARSRRPSLVLRGPEPVAEPTRGTTRASSRPASAGPPPETAIREHLRRKSATPAPAAPIVTAASRRSKRPAPGPVTSSQDGGAAVSVGKRKNAPRKRGTAAAANAAKKAAEGTAKEKEEDEAAAEEIDPDEPRYCLCGDVSFGTMICCENLECEKEWFHLDCVGLQEPPGRRATWYCPDCKTKLGKK